MQAEQHFLGALLANNRALDRAEFLRPHHFADPVHGRIFAVIRRRIEAGQLADAVTLRAEMEHANTLEDVGGVAYLAQLLVAAVSPSNAGEYARVIHDCWTRRELILLGETLIERGYGAGEYAGAIPPGAVQVGQAEAALASIVEGAGEEAPLASAGNAAAAALALCDAAAKAKGGLTGITTGYHALDRMTGGWRGGDLLLIGARPSMGKTSLAVGMAGRAAAAGARTLFVSAEMDNAQLGARLIAALAGLPVMAVLRGAVIDHGANEFRQLNMQECHALHLARARMDTLPLEFLDRGAMTVSAIRSRARRMKRDRKAGGLDLIVIDYIGLLKGSDESRRQNRNTEVSEISQGLKALAMELRVPVIALSQLSREVERREDRTPMLSDLRDSGTLEQDADFVAFLYRAHYYLSRNPPVRGEKEKGEAFDARLETWHRNVADTQGKADLIVAKHRQGAVGRVPLRFVERMTWFFDEREGPDASAL